MTRKAMSRQGYAKRRRRSGVRIVVALLLGVITTVGGAWACALWSPSSTLVTAVTGTNAPSYDTGIGVVGTTYWRRVPGQTLTSPSGIMCGDEASTYSIETPGYLTPGEHRMAFGWPLQAMSYRFVARDEELFGMRLVGALSGADGVSTRWRGIAGRHIPLTPQPIGFAVNTLTTALLVFLLLGGGADVRAFLRVRRGLCPRCAYDARGLAQCPECGLEASRSTPASASSPDARLARVFARRTYDCGQGLQSRLTTFMSGDRLP